MSFLAFRTGAGAAGMFAAAALMLGPPSVGAGALVDFERGFPVSGGSAVGFRSEDRKAAALVEPGAAGSNTAARVILDPSHDSFFLQGPVRRFYLVRGGAVYEPGLANVLVFHLKAVPGSSLVRDDGRNTLGVWTYHWEPGDLKVGGPANSGLMTDSMMHGYANFHLAPGCEERWLKVTLSPSAFQQQRDYFHWYAAQGVTGEHDFIGTLRQLQFKYLGPWEEVVDFELDEIGFENRPETARVEPPFARREVSVRESPTLLPLVLRNPTERARRYRYFVSSELGASRKAMYVPMWQHDRVFPGRKVQQAVGGDGGLGAAVLADAEGKLVSHQEIEVPAGGEWSGVLVHRVRPEMLGPWTEVTIEGSTQLVRRDTLTTSVVFWDPAEPIVGDMGCVGVAPSNADDGNHRAPPGFPKQVRPPVGWRSEDIPLWQVGGYFVSELTLRP
jgi:hypothetical protein